jgi:hydroxylysine kinase
VSVDPLTVASAQVPETEAQRISAEHFDIPGKAFRLAGEKDQIFRIESERAGESYFLKIAHESEPEAAYGLVTRALTHVADASPAVPVPRIVPDVNGAAQLAVSVLGGPLRWTRLTTYMPGQLLKTVVVTPVMRRNVGRALAQLAVALESFNDPAAERRVGWDIAHAGDAYRMLDELDDIEDRDLLLRIFEHHMAVIGRRVAELRRQPVHNDLNTDNILVDPENDQVCGLIDFDDLTVSQVINDLAVAAAGHIADDSDPLTPALEVARGYHSISPLEPSELALLPALMTVRLAMYLVIGNWRARRFPENRQYILRKAPLVRAQMRRLTDVPASAAIEQAMQVRNR